MNHEMEQDGRKLRAQERRNQRRQQILSAARKVFSIKGYHACSVADIHEEARIARGTFYLYFPSKRAIFEDLLEQMFSQIKGAIRRIKMGPDAEPELEQMFRNVRAIIDVLERNRELTIILLREAVGLDTDFDLKLNTFYDRLSTMIEETLKLGQQMGLVRDCNTHLVAHWILGGLKEVMVRLLTDEEAPELDREATAREIMDYNLRGLYHRRG